MIRRLPTVGMMGSLDFKCWIVFQQRPTTLVKASKTYLMNGIETKSFSMPKGLRVACTCSKGGIGMLNC